jgi:hypothetical protein
MLLPSSGNSLSTIFHAVKPPGSESSLCDNDIIEEAKGY